MGVPWWLSGLRTWLCHYCDSGYCCCVGLIPGMGTSTCHWHSQKKKKGWTLTCDSLFLGSAPIALGGSWTSNTRSFHPLRGVGVEGVELNLHLCSNPGATVVGFLTLYTSAELLWLAFTQERLWSCYLGPNTFCQALCDESLLFSDKRRRVCMIFMTHGATYTHTAN